MTAPLNSKNLVLFKQRQAEYVLPGGTRQEEEQLIEQVDHELSPEEQSFVRHYLAYADTFLLHAQKKERAFSYRANSTGQRNKAA
jgi:hypothetical protein